MEELGYNDTANIALNINENKCNSFFEFLSTMISKC